MKTITRICSLVCAALFALPLFPSTKTAVAQTGVPAGYKKELNEVMFWENEDIANQDGTLTTDESIWIYNYCPSIIQTDATTRYAYYCSNKYGDENSKNVHFNVRLDIDGDELVTDHIAARKGILYEGEWYWSPKQYVLSPVRGSWYEGEHLCDPNVIGGDFKYNGKSYQYLMAYLVTSYRECIYNHICLAVANDPMGPWLKCDDINPFVQHITDAYVDFAGNQIPAVSEEGMKTRLWGYGQASMINVDKQGKVLMFYSAIKPMYAADSNHWWAGALTQVDRWDLSNLNEAKYEFGIPFVSPTGIKRLGKQVDTMTNGDYAYDPAMNRIYGFFDGTWKTAEQETEGALLAFVENDSKSETPQIGDVFRDYPKPDWGSGSNPSWRTFAFIKPDDKTTFPHAHNVCIIRDEYGWIPDPLNLELAITGVKPCDLYEKDPGSWEEKHIWSYRILRKTLAVQCRSHYDYTGDYKCDVCQKELSYTNSSMSSSSPKKSGCGGVVGLLPVCLLAPVFFLLKKKKVR